MSTEAEGRVQAYRACMDWYEQGREPQEVCVCGHLAAVHSFDVCARCEGFLPDQSGRVQSDEMRVAEVVETFEIKGRGTAYIVVAGDPPYQVGDSVRINGEPMVVIGVEMRPTAVPQYVIDGKQSILTAPARTPSPDV